MRPARIFAPICLGLTCLSAALVSLDAGAVPAAEPSPFHTMSKQRVYIGTYTSDGRSAGIYTLELDPAAGSLGEPVVAARLTNPTFLAQGPDRALLISTCEVPASGDTPAVSGLTALRIQKDATLGVVNASGVAAKGPATHVTVSPDGRTAFVVHYNAAWVSSLPINSDGSLGKPLQVINHGGQTGPNASRQDKPHAHSIIPSPDGRQVYVCDLGLDLVYTYEVGTDGGLSLGSTVRSESGLGPRHSKVSSDGRFVYVLNELKGSVDVFAREPVHGALKPLQHLSTLREDFHGENTSAEIQLHPSGRFVYASNRGPDELVLFARDPQTGLLERREIVSSGGRHPRHFALSPDGAWLLCANRDTDNLVLFAVDPTSGRLRQVAECKSVPQPVCVLFATP